MSEASVVCVDGRGPADRVEMLSWGGEEGGVLRVCGERRGLGITNVGDCDKGCHEQDGRAEEFLGWSEH